MMASCYHQQLHSTWGDFAECLAKDNPEAFGKSQGPHQSWSSAEGEIELEWSIQLKSLSGPNAEQQATILLQRLQAETYISGLWIDPKEDGCRLFRGRYTDIFSPFAINELDQTRSIFLDGQQPFLDAQFIKPSAPIVAQSMDVRQLRGHYAYTLQVAVFDETHRNYGQAAQQEARRLRAEGHEAFYYHGNKMSMVTVGLFSDADRQPREAIDARGRRILMYYYGPRIKKLQETFPHNLVNGQVYHEPMGNGKRRPQASLLIPIR